ncbi:MAG: hypothetical protein ACRDTT_25875, partial [Pseudonocardiaceae bacterium]
MAEARRLHVKVGKPAEGRCRLGTVEIETPRITWPWYSAAMSPVIRTLWTGKCKAMLPSVWPGVDITWA